MTGTRLIGKDARGNERLIVGDEVYFYADSGCVLRFASRDWANLGRVDDRDAALALIDADRTARAAAILRGEA